MTRTVVAVGGFSSNVGKTTLMTGLLRAFPGWEAIKITRGHYRSCGKDPRACCVSHLLSEEPLIISDRRQTYEPGKDTGKYWDAGASNVHWVIVTDAQVEKGINLALDRVSASGVLIEGTSFLKFINADFALMVARAKGGPIKSSARRVLAKADALYLSVDETDADSNPHQEFAAWRASSGLNDLLETMPLYTREALPQLIERIRTIHAALVA